MAVGNIVGVEPLPNGGYNFVDKAGAKKTLFGPAADELVQRFKASEALTAPQPTAKLDARDLAEKATPIAQALGGALGGIPGAVAGYLGGRAAQEAASDVPAEVPGAAPAKPAVPVGTDGPPASIAAPGLSPQQPQGARFAVDKTGDSVMKQLPDGRWVVETRTAPTRGGMVEKSRSVKGGFDPSEGYIDATVGAFKEQQAGEELGAATAAQQAAEERGFLEEQQRQLVAQQQQQQQQMETIKRGVAEKQVAYDIAQSRFNNFSEIDQDRIWKRKGTGARIISAISAALGAFGAALAKTPNFALEIINSEIERDIRSQEQEIAINRETAQNALADLQRQLGSMDLAKVALGAIQTQRVQLQLQGIANKAKIPSVVSGFQKANGMLMQSYADKLEDYRQKATGEVTKSIVNVPGSAGGTTIRPPSLDESQKIKTLYGDGSKKQQQGVGSERTTKIADNAQAINQAENVLKMLEPEDDSSFWEPLTPGVRSIPGTEQYAKSKSLAQETESLVTTHQKASGIGSTEDDRNNVRKGLIGEGSVSERRAGAEAIAEQSAARIAAEIATLPPEQQQQQVDALPPNVRARVGRALAR